MNGYSRNMKPCRLKQALALTLAATLAMTVFACEGPAPSKASGQAESPQQAAVRPVSPPKATPAPVNDRLTPGALTTYAYLLFTQAMLREDEEALLLAAPVMKEAAAPARVWMEAGIWLMGRRSSSTIPFLEQAQELWPEDMSLTMLHAEALMEAGMADKSIGITRAYLRRHPDSTDAKLELALLLVKHREFSEAEALLKDIPQKDRTPLVNYYQSRALVGMERPAEAIPYLQKAIKEMPDFSEALAELAFLYEKNGSLKEAAAVYERLLKQNFSPNDVRMRLINLNLSLGQPEKALRYLKDGPDDLDFQLTAANLFGDSRHYLQAENILKKVAERRDAPPEVFLMLADLVYEHRHDLDMALTWLKRMPKNAPKAFRADILHAQLLAEAGKDEDAFSVIRQGQLAHPDAAELHEFEARLFARQKRWAEALKTVTEAVAKWPESESLLFLQGSIQDESGDKKAALATMEKLLADHPNNFQALNYVGYTLAEENRDISRSIELLEKANGLAPGKAYIIDSLAWAYYRAGRNDEALREIRRAVAIDKKSDAAIWEHYGDIAAKAGARDEAKKAYRKVLDLKPANAEDVRKRMSRL